jgi:hypothetical protein
LPIVAKHLCQRVLFVAPVTEREKSVNVETTKRTLRQAPWSWSKGSFGGFNY